LYALKSEDELVAELNRIALMLSGVMDPLIYCYAASYFIYQSQQYQLKPASLNFLGNLLFNLVRKLDLSKYVQMERFIIPFFNAYFEYVEMACNNEFKAEILRRSGEVKSRRAVKQRRRNRDVQGVADAAAELPAEKLQDDHEGVLGSG
jgi:hypothetical protein